MIFPVGNTVNMAAVVAGSLLGMMLGERIPERIRGIIFQALGLCTLIIGLQMALLAKEPLLFIGSLLIGGLIGEAARLEDRFTSGGEKLKGALKSRNPVFTEGLVAASLLFCIGSLAILGPFEEVTMGSRAILYTKSTLDFCASIALAAKYGSGVTCSGVVVFLYQGIFFVGAVWLKSILTEDILRELNAVGGVLVLGIGINMLGIANIRLSSLLPALVFALVGGVILL
ncbi:MAG: putative membrane protein YdfK [Desulfovibrio sp.]